MELPKDNREFVTSVRKALTEIDPQWEDYGGLIIVGSHTPINIEAKLMQLKEAREEGVPTLGICLGMQFMVIEYCKNVLGWEASSEELEDDKLYVITKLESLRVGIKEVQWKDRKTWESHWHNYALQSGFITNSMEPDWNISFTDTVAEIIALKNHPFYIGVQFHPEYQSSTSNPHQLLVDFINVCKAYV